MLTFHKVVIQTIRVVYRGLTFVLYFRVNAAFGKNFKKIVRLDTNPLGSKASFRNASSLILCTQGLHSQNKNLEN